MSRISFYHNSCCDLRFMVGPENHLWANGTLRMNGSSHQRHIYLQQLERLQSWWVKTQSAKCLFPAGFCENLRGCSEMTEYELVQNSSYWNPWQLGNLPIKPWCLLINEGSASTPAAARKSIIMHLMHGVSPLPQSPKTSRRRLWGSWGRSLSARLTRWATTSSSCSPPQAPLTSPTTKF